LWIVQNGTVEPYEDDLEAYRQMCLASRGGKGKKERAKSDLTGADGASDVSKKEARQIAAQKRAELAPLRKKLKSYEKQLEKLHAQIDKIDEQLGDTSLYTNDPDKASSFAAERGKLAKELAQVEEDWLMLSEELEDAMS
jgi:ATP-binding cassette subfamily F protein 3